MTHRRTGTLGGIAAWLPGGRAGRIESAAVLRLVAACAESGTAAETILAAWAADSRAAQGRRLRSVATAIGREASVADAIMTVPGVVQDEDLVAIRFGDRMGLLPQLAAIRRADVESIDQEHHGIGSDVAFAVTLVVVAIPLTVFLVLKIAPQFDKILADSGLARPWIMQSWLDTCAAIARLLRPVAVAVAVAMPIMLVSPLRRALLAPIGRGRRVISAIDTLAVAAAAGIPPTSAADVLAGCQTDARVARRLWSVPGDGCVGSRLAGAGLVDRAEGSRIDAAGPDGLADALTDASDRRRERGRQRIAVWEAGFLPTVALLFGAFVLLQALAVFVPMIDMIQLLAEGSP